MMPAVKGRCPRHWKVMEYWAKYLICDSKRYCFPFKVWYCGTCGLREPGPGVYMWAGTKHKLVDLRQATHTEPLEQQVKDRLADSDYAMISLKCPHCKSTWPQTKITCTPTMTCPFCYREISQEEAKKP